MIQYFRIGLAVLCVVVAIGLSVDAKTLTVANNGVDSATCGAVNAPCRSISQAITNAVDGDTITVGPGLYGDLNGDGTIGNSPGEENGPASCTCMILVNKRLTIVSRDGAAATVLDADAADVDVVQIEADKVTFGQPKKGFTLNRAGGPPGNFRTGLFISSGNGVKVGGNLSKSNAGHGFFFNGSGHAINNNIALDNVASGFVSPDSASGFVVNSNLSLRNGSLGFDLEGSGHKLSNNFATANHSSGFFLFGSGQIVTGNVSSANGADGFFIRGSGHQLNGNIASANSSTGFALKDGNRYQLIGNAARGNFSFGIWVFPGVGATIKNGNIFGNNGQSITVDSVAYTNCGLFSQSSPLTATNNFWGATGGPGVDPADAICPNANSTTVTPVAAREFLVRTLSPVDEPALVEPAESSESALPTDVRFMRALQTKEGLLFRVLGDVSALRAEIIDLSGRSIYDSGFVKGSSLAWMPVNSQNRLIANGVYLYRMTARDREGREIVSELRKLLIQR
ncbi:right-handed parallel beta-helix repeat-containing protein [Candidatus Acetothermia bacterium]|nr:right-handed parallel beta-helix repeat-containing protein [Candidatus Acetothermia bacterium]MBI3660263.1 right-handed parallel beta-helix repeat-containing protein [Candidatus Acetothermia bacterium]